MDLLTSVIMPASGQTPRQMVILLHGLGASGEDLLPLASMWAPHLPETVFLSPDAPYLFDGVGPYGFEWFSMRDMHPLMLQQGIEKVTPVLEQYIDEQLKRYDIKSTQLAVVGFSQGGAMAMHVGLHRNPSPAAIISISGAVFHEGAEAALHHSPVLLIHGDEDEVLPVNLMYSTKEYLGSKGINAETHVCQGLGHSINEEGIEKAQQFLKKHFRIK